MESKRITGTEMEWAAMVPGPADRLNQLTAEQISPRVEQWVITRNLSAHGGPSGYYLANGSRLYADVGDHREYATPEDDSFMGTLANELAGERIMTETMGYFQDKYEKKVSLVKRVIDDQNRGSGYHISYSANAERLGINEDDLALFGVFAATRSVVFGAGGLLGDGKFVLGQKAYTVNCDFNTGTTGSKPVVNLRAEHLADSKKFLRVHDTSSDPNMSPWSTRVKLAAGSLVLKLIEEDHRLDNLRFDACLTSVTRAVTQDVDLSERFKMVGGGSMTALGVQRALIREARKLKNSTAEELWALDEWERAVRELQQNPRLTANRVEWVIRQRMLEKQHELHGWGWKSQELRSKDRQFSEFMVGGIGQALRESDRAWAPYMPTQALIDKRIFTPPATTRASIRGAFIDFIHKCQLKADFVSWEQVKFNGKYFKLHNPFDPRHAELEDAMSKARNMKNFIEAIPA